MVQKMLNGDYVSGQARESGVLKPDNKSSAANKARASEKTRRKEARPNKISEDWSPMAE